MSIPFTCPHCRETFKAKDEFAGTRVHCPNPKCKKPVLVPKPRAAAQPAPTPAAGPPPKPSAVLRPELPANGHGPSGEAKPASGPSRWKPAAATSPPPAAANATNTPAAPPPTPNGANTTAPPPSAPAQPGIEVTCQFCDTKYTVDRSKAGKNAPCSNPECRRLNKVPLPKPDKPVDWRTGGDNKPSLARRDTEPAPEGAWGTTDEGTRRVSRETLEAVGAVPEFEEDAEPLTTGEKVLKAAKWLTLVAVVGCGVWLGMRYRSETQQQETISLAVKYLDPKKPLVAFAPAEKAVLHRLIGDYRRLKGQPQDALRQYQSCRALLIETPPSHTRSVLLTELALSQAELMGEPVEMERRNGPKWDDMIQAEMRQTLQNVAGPDAADHRAMAFPRLARTLAGKNEVGRAVRVVRSLSLPDTEKAELIAGIGLELLQLGQTNEATNLADEVKSITESLTGAKPATLPLPRYYGLVLALSPGEPDRSRGVPPRPRPGPEPTPLVRLTYAVGHAGAGQWDQARAMAMVPGNPEFRLRALAEVASVALAGSTRDDADLTAAVTMLEKEFVRRSKPPVVVYRLAALAARAGKPELTQTLAESISDPGLQRMALRDALAARLHATVGKPADMDWVEEVGDGPAGLEAVELIARHNATVSGAAGMVKLATAWPAERERDKPFAFAGAALGARPTDGETK